VTRVLAVLGYSDRRHRGLHPICAARLERALAEAEPDDTVILSGWSRKGHTASEAELMRAAWTAACAELVCDVSARTTAENAVAAAALAESRRASRLVVVTSAWHAPRAKILFLAQLRGTGIELGIARAEGGPRPSRALLRELVRWPLVPFQLRRRRPRGTLRDSELTQPG
jgi:uncharacterized SAM-binding protein YcdF (DUF218 family)